MTIRYAIVEQPASHQNQLLAGLPLDIKAEVAPHLELVSLPPGEIVYEAGYAERYAYFPNDAIVSLLSVIECGKSAEISVVGNEGIVGIDALVGGSNPCSQAVVQSAGSAYRMPTQLLKDQFNRHVELRWLILRYMQSLITQMSQTAVCYRHHSVEQQVCRRLLLSLDRISGDELPLTQEKIAYLLGVRREGVTRVSRTLRELGVIEARRGHIKVLDRDKLEELSCECYAVVKAESDCLLRYSCIAHRRDGATLTSAPVTSRQKRPEPSLRPEAQSAQA